MAKRTPSATDRHAERQQEARRALERVARDSETIGSSSLARAARHFKARDGSQDDDLEILGKRIGRALSLVAFVGLALYLFYTYVMH